MSNVIVLASGQSTRLRPLTNNIPKVLLNAGQHTALFQQIKFWTAVNVNQTYLVDKIYLVVHPQYVRMVEAYRDMNNLTNLVIVPEPKSNGSFEAIRNVVNQYPELQYDVFLNWGDLIPLRLDDEAWLKSLSLGQNSNIIFTSQNNCRYATVDGQIIYVQTGGNIPGLYYMNKMPAFDSYNVGDDMIQYIEDWVDVPCEVIDIGDMAKLTAACSAEIVSRDFNSVHIKDDVVTKIALNDKGVDLQEKELNWYKQNPPHTPKILETGLFHFKMDRVKGQPLYQCYQPDDEVKALAALDDLHKTSSIPVDRTTVIKDLQIEIIDKSRVRKKFIDGLISGFGTVHSINKRPLIDFNVVITSIYEKINELNAERNTYAFIHGDPNFSNTFYDGQNISFIDPRGYFGETELFGPESYDRAKVLYALSGYDAFNANPNFGHYELNDGELTLQIPPLQSITNLDPKNNELFDEESYYWLALIWINLGGYFANNPLKAVLAYYYGMHLATFLFENK